MRPFNGRSTVFSVNGTGKMTYHRAKEWNCEGDLSTMADWETLLFLSWKLQVRQLWLNEGSPAQQRNTTERSKGGGIWRWACNREGGRWIRVLLGWAQPVWIKRKEREKVRLNKWSFCVVIVPRWTHSKMWTVIISRWWNCICVLWPSFHFSGSLGVLEWVLYFFTTKTSHLLWENIMLLLLINEWK